MEFGFSKATINGEIQLAHMYRSVSMAIIDYLLMDNIWRFNTGSWRKFHLVVTVIKVLLTLSAITC